MSVAREMRQELCDFNFCHFARMPLVMEQNEAPDPIDVGLFSPNAEMLATDNIADFVEKFGFVLTRGDA
jgi:hypothetical protein